MSVNKEAYATIRQQVTEAGALLVAVSKTKPVQDIQELYELGQRDFGENYVQELAEKQPQLPADIRWHFIGHLQTNKVKYIAPFVYMIHGVESFKLLKEINKQAARQQRVIRCLLQLHIAQEETKFGMNREELAGLLDAYLLEKDQLPHVELCGIMAMASFTSDETKIRAEFQEAGVLFNWIRETYGQILPAFRECSYGMSGDYPVALQEGSTMVRIGSLIFGNR